MRMCRVQRAAAASLLLAAACTGAVGPAAMPPAAHESLSPTPEPPASSGSIPLVLAVQALRPPIDIGRATARALLDGTVADWRALGEPRAPIRLIAGPGAAAAIGAAVPIAASDQAAVGLAARAARVVAAVPASALRPGVRAIRVDGAHPLRDARYAFRVTGTPRRRTASIIGVGDIMLARRVGERMRASGDPALPFRPTMARLASADLAFGNLECTLARLGPPTQGDAFAADPSAVEGLTAAGFDVLSLANNHTGDFGARSLNRTVSLARGAGIATVGAGAGRTQAAAPAIVTARGMRIGFLAFNAIGETPEAGAGRPGAVRIHMQPRLGTLRRSDLDAFLSRVRALRARADLVIVAPHWGAQYSHGIHHEQRAVARALVRAGAGAVIGTHPHWVGGMEVYRGVPIAYSLGNFAFDMDLSRQTMEAIAVELFVWDGRLMSVEPLPVRIGRDWVPRFVSGEAGRTILADVRGASGAPFAPSSSPD